ncbi:MAG: hypothetical protein A2V63_11710 [Candidatus Eisenbacteria bacterium RBG_19FT_COMBO_70_11]|nr:MAG: hypothetical protein A2V63_11710 [Candidatus Eisenbacteria bacterium RBG_19FT_COMBO_70_11]
MAQVHICIELSEESLRSFDAEARREKVTLQSLLERTVNGLLRDMEREEEEGTDHPIIAS